jgi:hypothetical protein
MAAAHRHISSGIKRIPDIDEKVLIRSGYPVQRLLEEEKRIVCDLSVHRTPARLRAGDKRSGDQ